MKRWIQLGFLALLTLVLAACRQHTVGGSATIVGKEIVGSPEVVSVYRLSVRFDTDLEVDSSGAATYAANGKRTVIYFPSTDKTIADAQLGDKLDLTCIDRGDILLFDPYSCRVNQ